MALSKIVFIILLLGTKVYALTFSLEKNTEYGKLQKAVVFNNNSSTLYKNTNFFDQDNKIGKFSINNSVQLKDEIEELKRLSKVLDSISEKVSDASSKRPPKHEKQYLKVNQHFIDDKHPLFKKVDKVVSSFFTKMKLSSIDSFELKGKNGEYFSYQLNSQDSNAKKGKLFREKEKCHYKEKFFVCSINKYGTLFLK